MVLPLSLRTVLASFTYLIISLLFSYIGKEYVGITPLEVFAVGWRWVSLVYYVIQVLLMVGYLRFQRLGCGVSFVVVVMVALLRSLSIGVAFSTVAMVMGREMVQRAYDR